METFKDKLLIISSNGKQHTVLGFQIKGEIKDIVQVENSLLLLKQIVLNYLWHITPYKMKLSITVQLEKENMRH